MLTTSTNSASLDIYYEKKLLETLEPQLQLYKLGMKQKLPKGNGKQVKWLRYSKVNANTTALTEGVPPSASTMPSANVTATVAQYGDYTTISDLLSDTAIDPVLMQASKRFGLAAADTVEQLIAAELDSEAFIKRVNDRASDNDIVAGDVLSHIELIQATADQREAYIRPHESGRFVAVISPAQQYDLMVATGAGAWLDVNKANSDAGRQELLRGDLGTLYGLRMVLGDRNRNEANGSSVDVHSAYIIGAEAFGVVELGGDSIKMFRKAHGSGGSADPLNQVATVGYKIHGFAAKYLDASSKRVIQLRSSSAK